MSPLKVAVIGHLPVHAGGKQYSGLAAVIWNLCHSISHSDQNIDVSLIATDIHEAHTTIDQVNVYGWNYRVLTKCIILNIRNLPSFLVDSTIFRIRFKLPILTSLLKLFFFQYRLTQLNPDVIHIHGCIDAALFGALKLKKKNNAFLTLHGINGVDPSLKNYLELRKLESTLCSYNFLFVTFISHRLKEIWEINYGQFPSPVYVIQNGYDPAIFSVDSVNQNNDRSHDVQQKIRLFTLGSVTQLKGQLRVIQALALIKVKNVNFSYDCIGPGDPIYISELDSFAKANGIDVTFTGAKKQTELAGIITKFDFMIMPSSSEGFGLAFLESIACGVTVIVPKTLPITHEPGLLSDINSVFIEDERSESIANCLDSLTIRSINKNEIAATVKDYCWHKIAERYIQIICNHLNLN